MLKINGTSYPDAAADEVVAILGDAPETILVLSFPATDHDDLQALLDAATELVDEQERTISRYTPRICYAIADMDGRTYAKVRIADMSTGDNPDYYKTLRTEAEQQVTALEISRAAAEQRYTAAMLHAAAVEGGKA